MKNIITLSLVLGAAAMAGGCIIESNNNPPPPPPGHGTVTATWDLQDWNDQSKQAVTANCPAGADTAIVYSLLAGDTNAADATKDLFNCADFTGTTASLPADSYTEWVEITDHSGATLYAQSSSQQIAVGSGLNTTLSFPFQVNRGYVTAAWTLRGASGAPLDCTTAGAGGVEFDNMVGTNTPISDQFNCTDGMGTTYPLPIANYQFAAQAIDSSPTPKGIGPATVAGPANVQYGNQLVNKGSLVLTVDGL